jgi:oligosaccharyltransferase complex subunit gamma
MWANSLLLLCICIFCITYGNASSRKRSKGSGPPAPSAPKFVPRGDSASDRLNHLQSLARDNGGNVIALDNESYEYFVIDKPRDYSLLVFLTAADPAYKCAVCPDVENDVNIVYKSYLNALQRDNQVQDTFFVKLDFAIGADTFIEYELNTVPVLFYINKKDSIGEGKSLYNIPKKERFAFPESTNADSIAEWVKFKTGVDVIIEKSAIVAYIMTIICFVGIAKLVPRIINSLDTFWLPIARSKTLWAVISIAMYLCGISGLIYDILRDAPWYHVPRDRRQGSIIFFYPQAQQQFILEGFIIGFLNLGAAASLIWTVVKAPTLETAERRTLGVVGGMTSFAVFFWQVRSLYIMKNQWYGTDM